VKRTAVVGGGILGLTLALRLAQHGVAVDLLEAAPELGGLAGPFDYGEFVWDRFYHCILPSDRKLIGLLGELGLEEELRWSRTGTGYFANGREYPMNGNRDFLAFPLLSFVEKARLAWVTIHARRFANPYELYSISAQDWLTRHCGAHAYEVFWKPLLQAKFGTYHDKIAATFIWATITRLFGARSGAAKAEHLGYVSGGYARILRHFRAELERRGVRVRTGTRVRGLERSGSGCQVQLEGSSEEYAQVFLTTPTRLARAIAGEGLAPVLDEFEREHPSATTYLGVICCNLVLERPLTPYYVLNLGAGAVGLTGVIEMTNLIDPRNETHGRSLVYLPRYLPSDAPEFDRADDELRTDFVERGLLRVFPGLDRATIRASSIQRARFVQALPLVRPRGYVRQPPSRWQQPIAVLNTAMLECATLNNNEVVGLVDDYIGRHEPEIGRLRDAAQT
jgi:protoporphyrinogen oxidase